MSHYVGGRKSSSFLGLYIHYINIVCLFSHNSRYSLMNRSLHTNVMSELEQEGNEESGRDEQLIEDSSDVPSSSSASLCNQTSIPKERGDESDDSDSDSDEDCDKQENVFTEVDLDATTSSTNQDLSSSAVESESITSHCSSSTVEEETDSGGSNKQQSSKRMSSYRLATVSCC